MMQVGIGRVQPLSLTNFYVYDSSALIISLTVWLMTMSQAVCQWVGAHLSECTPGV